MPVPLGESPPPVGLELPELLLLPEEYEGLLEEPFVLFDELFFDELPLEVPEGFSEGALLELIPDELSEKPEELLTDEFDE